MPSMRQSNYGIVVPTTAGFKWTNHPRVPEAVHTYATPYGAQRQPSPLPNVYATRAGSMWGQRRMYFHPSAPGALGDAGGRLPLTPDEVGPELGPGGNPVEVFLSDPNDPFGILGPGAASTPGGIPTWVSVLGIAAAAYVLFTGDKHPRARRRRSYR